MDIIQEKQGDIYTQVREAIDSDNPGEAIRSINRIEDQESKLLLLRDLAGDLTLDLDRAIDRAIDHSFVHSYANAIALASALARALALALDFAITPDLDLDHALDHALDYARALARALARDDDQDHDQDHDRDIIPVPVPDLSLDFEKKAVSVIVRVLSNWAGNEEQFTVQFSANAGLIGIDQLTPATLARQIAPYFQAVIDIEAVIADLQGQEFVQPKIRGISQNSPVNISLEGAGDTVNAIKEIVVPWRREHARMKAQLEEAKGKAEIREIETRVTQTEQEKLSEEEQQLRVERQRLEVERMRLENKRLELELDKERITLAIQVIDKFRPNLEEAERMAYVMRLLAPLLTLTQSPLELTKPQKPTTLPEMG